MVVGSSLPAHPYMGQALQENEIQPTSLCQQKHVTLGLAAASHTRRSIGSSAGAIVLSRTTLAAVLNVPSHPPTHHRPTSLLLPLLIDTSSPIFLSSSVLRRRAAHHCDGLELLMLRGSWSQSHPEGLTFSTWGCGELQNSPATSPTVMYFARTSTIGSTSLPAAAAMLLKIPWHDAYKLDL